MNVLALPPEKVLKPLARLRLLGVDMAASGSGRPEIVAALIKAATREDEEAGFAYWARHLARDLVAAARKPGGASPRAGSHNGQTDFGWGLDPVYEGLAAIDRYCHRYIAIIEKVDLGRRVAALVRPYADEHDVSGMTLLEVARLAGVTAEDLEALAA